MQLNKAFYRVEKILNILLALMFFAMFIVVMLQVVTRYIAFVSLPWTEELTRLAFVYIIALGAPLAIKYDDYAKVDLLVELFPLKARLFTELIVSILILFFSLYVAYTSWDMIALGMRQKSVYLRIPMYYAYFALPLCFALTTLASVFKVYERAKDFMDPQRVIDRELEEERRNREENAEHEKLIEEAAGAGK